MGSRVILVLMISFFYSSLLSFMQAQKTQVLGNPDMEEFFSEQQLFSLHGGRNDQSIQKVIYDALTLTVSKAMDSNIP